MNDEKNVGKTCPYCQTPIKPHDDVVMCTACQIPHHVECWRDNGKCTTYGCVGQPGGSPQEARRAMPPNQPPANMACPTCGYMMTAFDATCPRCANLQRQGLDPRLARAQLAPPPGMPVGAPTVPQVPGYAQPPQMYQPNPGYQDRNRLELNEIRGWNWGAFFLPLIWSAAMSRWDWFFITLVCSVCGCMYSPLLLFPAIYLGIQGNELAWTSRRWYSVSEFKATQDVWKSWGIGTAIGLVGLFLILIGMVIADFS